jgi:uncharacterized protein (TIGR02145 family)
MKNIYWILGLVLILLLLPSCKKEKEDDGSIKDFDGNNYTSVVIGTQTWMVENLKTTHFKDGSEIPLKTNNTDWGNLSSPGYCWYNNDESSNKSTSGAMYNWYTVNTGNLCPSGWHVPIKEEWDLLSTYLGGDNSAGGKLKEIGTTHWRSPNLGATNESGFTGLPGGQRDDKGTFLFLGMNGFWWTNTLSYSGWAYSRELDYDYSNFFSFNDKIKFGFSVRCIKD